jgi:hypothetical protein
MPGLQTGSDGDQKLIRIIDELFSGERTLLTDAAGGRFVMWKKGKGRIIQGPYEAATFDELGIHKDFQPLDENEKAAGGVAWNHRKEGHKEIYFVANQEEKVKKLQLSFRVKNKTPEFYDPVSGETRACPHFKTVNGTTILTYRFEPNESLFVIFSDVKSQAKSVAAKNWIETTNLLNIEGSWEIQFDPDYGGPAAPVIFNDLTDWSKHSDDRIRFYSGTAIYTKSFQWDNKKIPNEVLWLELGSFANMAEVKLNGQSCGICWTPPFRVRIDPALKKGDNILEIAVTNTWANRLQGDHALPKEKQITWTTAPYRLEGKPLLPAGLFGPVTICKSK